MTIRHRLGIRLFSAMFALCLWTGAAFAVCGDAILDLGEVCDDGNLINGDGCDSNCTATGCGNTIVTAGEACDDGIGGSATCDPDCTLATCGDGTPNSFAGELCDDGNPTEGDGCDSNCTVTSCGNGILTAGESCDDGNLLAGDGCRANCTVELCGDGLIDPADQCDDGNLTSGDGCDANCTTTGCGNSVLTAGEQCDDSNLADGDGCSSSCLLELLNPVPAASDHFGAAVAAMGSNVLVGVPLHDQLNAINTGLAYLYNGTTFELIRTFQNPTPNPGDQFGFAVGVVGPNVVIGAPFDDTLTADGGAVYVFNGTTGALVRTILNPTANGSKQFGFSVANLDDTNVLIGAPLDHTGLFGGGVAYLFNATTGSLQQVYLNPSPAADVEFGRALIARGPTVLVGAPGHDIAGSDFIQEAPAAGAVYLFDASTGTLLKTIENPGGFPGHRFGHAVQILENDLLVGAPTRHAGAVYLLDGTSGAVLNTFLPPVEVGDDQFGSAIATAGGNRVVVGAPFGDAPGPANTGAVYVFDAVTSLLLQTITKATPTVGDEFGRALTTVGGRIVVGAPLDDTVEVDAGAVYSFPDDSCGNGVVDPTESCDDGALVNGDGCDANCQVTGCGNGVVTAPEECDDGNIVPGDGCSPSCGLEGACGDGVQSLFEQCDDGNVVSGDGCDSNCTPTACGNGVVAGPEECDDGAGNGSDLCCSATCTRLDADGDGFCDRDDVCPNTPDPAQSNIDGDTLGDACDMCPGDVNNDSDGDLFCTDALFNPPGLGGQDPCARSGDAGTWLNPRASFSHLGTPIGDDRMRLKGRFTVGSLLPTIAPQIHGVHVRVTDVHGALVLDETIPGGSPSALRGWKTIGTLKNKWVYTDRTDPPVHNGISKIIIKNLLFRDPYLFTVAVQADGGTFGLAPNDEPIRVTVELNPDAIPSGGTPGRDQCGEIQYLQNVKPMCVFNGFKLFCK